LTTTQPSIWEKIDYELVAPPAAKPAEEPKPDAESKKRRWRNRRRALDVLSTVFWTYAFLKVFVADIDRTLANSIGLNPDDAVRYRFFGFLALLAIGAIVVRKWTELVITIVYIAVFPLIVLFWKLPRAIHRTRSWVAFFAVANAAASSLINIRYTIIFLAGTLISALLIFVTDDDVVITCSAVVIAIALCITLGRTIRYAAFPSRFLKVQQDVIRRAVDSDVMKSLTSVNADLRHTELTKFTAAQQNQFVQNLSHGVLCIGSSTSGPTSWSNIARVRVRSCSPVCRMSR
jgi:hypothetical protein